MKLIVGSVYHLNGQGFAESVLTDNKNLFKLDSIDSFGDWVFKGVFTNTPQWMTQDMIDNGEAKFHLVKEKSNKGKRKKGPAFRLQTVIKAKIVYKTKEEYTLKNFQNILFKDGQVSFIYESNYRQSFYEEHKIVVLARELDQVIFSSPGKKGLLAFTDNGVICNLEGDVFTCSRIDLLLGE